MGEVSETSGNCCAQAVVTHIELLVIELGELAEDSGSLVSVLAHGGEQGLGGGRADRLLVVGDVTDEQGAELRDQLQTQRLPQPGGTQ